MTSRHPNSRILENAFLFDFPGSKRPNSSRKVHIRRLVDILQLSIHRHDWRRAQRAWCILARCKEFEWKSMWKTGLLLAGSIDSNVDISDAKAHPQRLEYLRVMMLRSPEHRVPILQELILYLIVLNRHQIALDELELYLPSPPYQDSPVLHIYAGLLRLYLAQASANLPLDNNPTFQNDDSLFTLLRSVDDGSIQECKSHLQRALDIDPGNPVASEFIAKLTNSSPAHSDADNESEADPTSKLRRSAVEKRLPKKRREQR